MNGDTLTLAAIAALVAASTVRKRSGSGSAVAKRSVHVNDRWTTVPAHLTTGHNTELDTHRARPTSRRAGERLGQGNFGITYRVQTQAGPRVVKVPAPHSIHGTPWDLDELRRWFIHEAGVANELAALGYRIVPRTVFVDKPIDTVLGIAMDREPIPFALVREYGEPVTSLTPGEFSDLERALFDLENESGWVPADELLVLRRRDGSLFIGDVGIWSAPTQGGRETSIGWHSNMSHLMPTLAGQVVSKQAGRAPSMASMLYQLQRLDKTERDRGGIWDEMWNDHVEDLRNDARKRRAVGLTVPPEIQTFLAQQHGSASVDLDGLLAQAQIEIAARDTADDRAQARKANREPLTLEEEYAFGNALHELEAARKSPAKRLQILGAIPPNLRKRLPFWIVGKCGGPPGMPNYVRIERPVVEMKVPKRSAGAARLPWYRKNLAVLESLKTGDLIWVSSFGRDAETPDFRGRGKIRWRRQYRIHRAPEWRSRVRNIQGLGAPEMIAHVQPGPTQKRATWGILIASPYRHGIYFCRRPTDGIESSCQWITIERAKSPLDLDSLLAEIEGRPAPLSAQEQRRATQLRDACWENYRGHYERVVADGLWELWARRHCDDSQY